MKGLSQRAYARHRGVNESAVRKAIKSGRITPNADGTIDPDKADFEWEQNTHQGYNPSSQDGMGTGSPTTYQQAKTANEVYKAQTAKLELDKLKGTLIDRKQAEDTVFRLARAERDAWLNWPNRVSAELAAKFQIDEAELFTALNDAVRQQLTEIGEMDINLV